MKGLRRAGRVIQVAVTGVLAVLLLGNLYLLTAEKLFGVSNPTFFGYTTAIVTSGSMEPALWVDDLILIHAQDSYQQGDIITYQSDGGLVTHRVVENDTASQELVTKGDANAQADVYPVGYDRVIGRVEYSIPYWGRMATALRQPSGIAICAAIFALALVLWTVADRGKSKRGNTARQDPAKKA